MYSGYDKDWYMKVDQLNAQLSDLQMSCESEKVTEEKHNCGGCTCSSSDSMRALIGLMPDPVAKSRQVGWPAAGARSIRKPLPITGDTETSPPTHTLRFRFTQQVSDSLQVSILGRAFAWPLHPGWSRIDRKGFGWG